MKLDVEGPLGRLEPETRRHEELYPFAAVEPVTVDVVENVLRAPGWRVSHDQGSEGSCVGHAVVLERAMTNRMQAVVGGDRRTVRYDPLELWHRAKAVDYWKWTNPGDTNGTSVDAAYKVAAAEGLRPVRRMRLVGGVPTVEGGRELDVAHGVSTYRWARTVDEVRTALWGDLPVAIGVAWHRGFDAPVKRRREFWLPTPAEGLGAVRGGHAVCLTGASDRRQAFRLVNSWGRRYPLVWMPYDTLAELLARGGEAAVVTDR